MNHLGLLLEQARKSQGLTQQQLGETLGVTRQTIAKWESGDIPDTAMRTVCGFIGETIAKWDESRRHWQAKHDLLEYETSKMKIQIRSIVG